MYKKSLFFKFLFMTTWVNNKQIIICYLFHTGRIKLVSNTIPKVSHPVDMVRILSNGDIVPDDDPRANQASSSSTRRPTQSNTRERGVGHYMIF
jgi:hypothetical protein